MIEKHKDIYLTNISGNSFITNKKIFKLLLKRTKLHLNKKRRILKLQNCADKKISAYMIHRITFRTRDKIIFNSSSVKKFLCPNGDTVSSSRCTR